MIKMNGVVPFVLCRNDDHSISGDSFIERDVNAQKKANDQKTDHKDGNNFTLWRFSHRSVLLKDPRLNANNFIIFDAKSQIQFLSSVLGMGSLKKSIFSSRSIFSSSAVADPLMFFFSLTPYCIFRASFEKLGPTSSKCVFT